MDPKIYLSVDNVFASKRWTRPEDWLRVIGGLGVRCAEASADTECDPLYAPAEYLEDWSAAARAASAETGVRVSQFYSGHGTYATTGLAHRDSRVRAHILNNWLRPMCRLAGSFGASLGFFCHAFDQAVLADAALHAEMKRVLYENLATVARWAHQAGCPSAGVEQMYSPHQVPWTLEGAEELLREVNALAGVPFYLTLDVGHQTGQRRFLPPEGPAGQAAAEKAPHLYAKPEDGDTLRWLQRFGCYSPIVHLQQTDGKTSSHRPFTPESNAAGVVRGQQVLAALHRAYQAPQAPGMPPRVDKIYLTLEIFSATADRPEDILARMAQSAAYWRRFIPEDGLPLSTLAERAGQAAGQQ